MTEHQGSSTDTKDSTLPPMTDNAGETGSSGNFYGSSGNFYDSVVYTPKETVESSIYQSIDDLALSHYTLS